MKLNTLLLVTLIVSANPVSAGQLLINACMGSSAAVSAVGVKGKWLGFSVKTSSGEIRDVSPVKVSLGGMYQGRFRFNGKDVVSARASTWDKKKGNGMQGRRDDTGWVNCN